MGSLIATGASSAYTAFCCGLQGVMCACTMARCCCSMKPGEGQWNPRAAKAGYVLMLGLSTIMALIMRFYKGPNGKGLEIKAGPWQVGCQPDIPKDESIIHKITGEGGNYDYYCQGDAAVYRISFVLAVFFFIMMIGSKVFGEGFHAGLWGVKLFIYIGMMVGCFFIDNSVFNNSGYAWVSRITSALFLVLQILILVEFGYKWNESWVNKAYEGALTDYDGPSNKSYLYYILACAGVMYIGSIVGIVLMFVYYGKPREGLASEDDCGTHNFFIAWTLISVIAMTALSLFREQLVGEGHRGAILPAAVISAYCTYLLWSAMNSDPNFICNPSYNPDNGGPSTANVVLGLLVATISLMYTAYSASVNAGSLWDGGNDEESAAAAEKEQIEAAAASGERTPLGGAEAGGGLERGESHMSLEDGNESRSAAKYTVSNGSATGNVDGEAGKNMSAKERGIGEPYWFFHLIMCTASMYMAMLLTNWGSGEKIADNTTGSVGKTSLWVKILSQWLTFLLYIWTLVAPRCCPNREFEH